MTAGPTTTLEPIDKPTITVPETEPTELKVTTLVEGEGDPAKAGDTLQVMYVGARWADGIEFENNYEANQPIPVVLGTGGVIAGWDEGLIGVQAGGRYQLAIPAEMAYGTDATDRPAGALIFVVDIRSITPAVTPTS